MGTIHFVACLDCKVTRDLDKFYNHRKITDRADAIDFAEEMTEEGDKGFRASLLVSFLSEHKTHTCVFFNENDDVYETFAASQFLETGFKRDTDFFETP